MRAVVPGSGTEHARFLVNRLGGRRHNLSAAALTVDEDHALEFNEGEAHQVHASWDEHCTPAEVVHVEDSALDSVGRVKLAGRVGVVRLLQHVHGARRGVECGLPRQLGEGFVNQRLRLSFVHAGGLRHEALHLGGDEGPNRVHVRVLAGGAWSARCTGSARLAALTTGTCNAALLQLFKSICNKLLSPLFARAGGGETAHGLIDKLRYPLLSNSRCGGRQGVDSRLHQLVHPVLRQERRREVEGLDGVAHNLLSLLLRDTGLRGSRQLSKLLLDVRL